MKNLSNINKALLCKWTWCYEMKRGHGGSRLEEENMVRKRVGGILVS